MTPTQQIKTMDQAETTQERECRSRARAKETPEQREQRLARRREEDREHWARARAEETPEQREQRLARRREQYRERRARARAEETPEQTPEQREQRLARRREQDRERRTLQSSLLLPSPDTVQMAAFFTNSKKEHRLQQLKKAYNRLQSLAQARPTMRCIL